MLDANRFWKYLRILCEVVFILKGEILRLVVYYFFNKIDDYFVLMVVYKGKKLVVSSFYWEMV